MRANDRDLRRGAIDAHDVADKEPAPRLQLKREIAGLSVDNQLDRLRPEPPLLGGLLSSQGDPSRAAPETPVQAHSAPASSGQVQADTGPGPSADGSIHESAAHGVAGPVSSLPHLPAIQQSFGGHDVTSVKAHLGPQASEASEAMGAKAYASGDHVAFKGTPDLHTAAHEAAHVVQQRAGVSLEDGVGRSGDAYERHADAVADRVVAGESAEGLLTAAPQSGGSSPPSVQHAKGGATQSTEVKLRVGGQLVKLKFTLEEGRGGGDGKGKVELTEALRFGPGPGLRIPAKTLISVEVKNGEIVNLVGGLQAFAFDADGNDLAELSVQIKGADTTGPDPKINGSAVVKTIQTLNLLNGAVTLAPKANFTVGIVDSQIDSFTLSNVALQINKVTDTAGRPLRGSVKTLSVKRGKEGWSVDIVGGKIGPVYVFQDRLSVTLENLSLKNSTDFVAIVSGSYRVNNLITLSVNGELASQNGWKPRLQFGANLNLPLMAGRTWFHFGGRRGGRPWTLLDVDFTTVVWLVPMSFGVNLGAGLAFGNTPIALQANFQTALFDLDLSSFRLPPISIDVSLVGGLFAEAYMDLALKAGVGAEPWAFGGIALTLGPSFDAHVDPKVTGRLEVDETRFGGSLDLGIAASAGVTLSIAPKLTYTLLGMSDSSPALVKAKHEFKDLFKWSDSYKLKFGTLYGDKEPEKGGNAHEPKGDGLEQARKVFEANNQPGKTAKTLDDNLPASGGGGGLMKDLKHVLNTAMIVHELLELVNSVRQVLPFDILKKPRLRDAWRLLTFGVDVFELTKRIDRFYQACRKARDKGTLAWLTANLPWHWRLIPGVIKVYLHTVDMGTDAVEWCADLLGFETPSEIKRRSAEDVKEFENSANLRRVYTKFYTNTMDLEYAWANNVAWLRVFELKDSALDVKAEMARAQLRVKSWEDAQAQALAQRDDAEKKAADKRNELVEKGIDWDTVESVIKPYKMYCATPDLWLNGYGGTTVNPRKAKFDKGWREAEQKALEAHKANPLAGRSPRIIVEKDCGADWNEVKKRFLEDDPPLMKALVEYRKAHVNAIIAEMKGKEQFRHVDAKAVGGEALTSDYDVSFYGKGAIQAVPTFNHMFRNVRQWGKESGTVFDTNVYTASVLHYTEPDDKGAQLLPVNDPKAKEKDAFYQDVAALTKVRHHMSADEWLAMKERVVGAIQDKEVADETARRYDAADKKFRNYVKELYNKIISDHPEVLKDKELAGLSPEKLVRKLAGTDVGMEASNRLYEEKLRLVQKLIDERDDKAKSMETGIEKDKAISKYNAEIRALYSDALMFANEAYYAQGTIRHVVGNLQANYAYQLEDSELFQSFTENYGDCWKDFVNYQGKPFGLAAFRTSKYVFRFTDAATELVARSKGKIEVGGDSANLKKLAELSGKLLAIRQGDVVDGVDYSDMPSGLRETAAEDYANEYGYEAMSQIIIEVDKIYDDLNAKARQAQIGT